MKPAGAVRLTIVPMTWRAACAFNFSIHRTHPKPPRGCKWAIGVVDPAGALRGVALCGRPVARAIDDGATIEINRTATDGCPNANSALYGACWRIAAAMGYRRIITYNQMGESGASLEGAGFQRIRTLPARGSWAEDSVRRIRDPDGSGQIERVRWEISA